MGEKNKEANLRGVGPRRFSHKRNPQGARPAHDARNRRILWVGFPQQPHAVHLG